jgi:hypothetical protein
MKAITAILAVLIATAMAPPAHAAQTVGTIERLAC